MSIAYTVNSLLRVAEIYEDTASRSNGAHYEDRSRGDVALALTAAGYVDVGLGVFVPPQRRAGSSGVASTQPSR